jgi:NAD dependent epimerase/dehydratase family enzyme
LACASQRVIAQQLSQAGHRFRQPDLDDALRHLLGRNAP